MFSVSHSHVSARLKHVQLKYSVTHVTLNERPFFLVVEVLVFNVAAVG